MFERFRRSRDTDAGATSLATRERDTMGETTADDRDRGRADDRVEGARFDRVSPGDTTLDRDRARDDMAARDEATTRDDPDMRDREPHHGMATGAAAAGAGAAAGAAIEHHHDRKVEREEMAREQAARDEAMREDTMAGDRGMAAGPARDLDRDGVDDRVERHAPVIAPAAMHTMRARQRDRFGGIQWGSDFFGWLCAIGLASILTALLVAAGVALGLSTTDASNPNTAQQIGLGGGIALLIVLAIAWFCGGYVAGRMARFDGARQGLGVWAWTIVAAVIVAAVAAVGGSKYDIFQSLNLPRIAVGGNTLTTGGAIAGAAAIVVTLLFAIFGGLAGERYHRRVDRVATDEYVVER